MATFRGERVMRGRNTTVVPPYTSDRLGQVDYEHPTYSVPAVRSHVQTDAFKQNYLMDKSVNDPTFKAGISTLLRYPTAFIRPPEGWDYDPI